MHFICEKNRDMVNLQTRGKKRNADKMSQRRRQQQRDNDILSIRRGDCLDGSACGCCSPTIQNTGFVGWRRRSCRRIAATLHRQLWQTLLRQKNTRYDEQQNQEAAKKKSTNKSRGKHTVKSDVTHSAYIPSSHRCHQ